MPIEYILLGVGIVLLGIEAVVPGFGFFGVTGLISPPHNPELCSAPDRRLR